MANTKAAPQMSERERLAWTNPSRSFPRKRDSRNACSGFVIWVPAFAATSGMNIAALLHYRSRTRAVI